MLVTLAEVSEQQWSRTDELLASLIEVVDATALRGLLPHVKKGARLPKPIAVPRPSRKKRGMTPSELREMLSS